MTENHIVIPDTIKFLYDKPVNLDAIGIIISRKEAPKDSTWNELYEFYTAQLAAWKTQYDHWCFQREICETVWENKLSQLNDYNETSMDYYDGENSLANIWETEEFYKCYKNGNDVEFWFGNMIDPDDGLRLYFHFYKKEYQSNDWELSDKWNSDPEEDTRYTREKMIPIVGQEIIDLQLLHEAVDEVINKIKG